MLSRSLVAALLVSVAGTAAAQPSADAPAPPQPDPGPPQPVPPPQEPPPALPPEPAPQQQPEPPPPPPATITERRLRSDGGWRQPHRLTDAGRNQRLVGLEIGGAGLLAIAVGAIAGLDARSKRDDARALGCTDDLSLCPPGDALDRAEDAYSRSRFATGFFIGGAIAIGAGAALWLTAPRETSRRWQATPSVGRSGTGVVLGRAF